MGGEQQNADYDRMKKQPKMSCDIGQAPPESGQNSLPKKTLCYNTPTAEQKLTPHQQRSAKPWSNPSQEALTAAKTTQNLDLQIRGNMTR